MKDYPNMYLLKIFSRAEGVEMMQVISKPKSVPNSFSQPHL